MVVQPQLAQGAPDRPRNGSIESQVGPRDRERAIEPQVRARDGPRVVMVVVPQPSQVGDGPAHAVMRVVEARVGNVAVRLGRGEVAEALVSGEVCRRGAAPAVVLEGGMLVARSRSRGKGGRGGGGVLIGGHGVVGGREAVVDGRKPVEEMRLIIFQVATRRLMRWRSRRRRHWV